MNHQIFDDNLNNFIAVGNDMDSKYLDAQRFHCYYCNKSCQSTIPWLTHLQSDKHQRCRESQIRLQVPQPNVIQVHYVECKKCLKTVEANAYGHHSCEFDNKAHIERKIEKLRDKIDRSIDVEINTKKLKWYIVLFTMFAQFGTVTADTGNLITSTSAAMCWIAISFSICYAIFKLTNVTVHCASQLSDGLLMVMTQFKLSLSVVTKHVDGMMVYLQRDFLPGYRRTMWVQTAFAGVTAGATLLSSVYSYFEKAEKYIPQRMTPQARSRPTLTWKALFDKLSVLVSGLLVVLTIVIVPLKGCKNAYKYFEPYIKLLTHIPEATTFMKFMVDFFGGEANINDVAPDIKENLKKAREQSEYYVNATAEVLEETGAPQTWSSSIRGLWQTKWFNDSKHTRKECLNGECNPNNCPCQCHVELVKERQEKVTTTKTYGLGSKLGIKKQKDIDNFNNHLTAEGVSEEINEVAAQQLDEEEPQSLQFLDNLNGGRQLMEKQSTRSQKKTPYRVVINQEEIYHSMIRKYNLGKHVARQVLNRYIVLLPYETSKIQDDSPVFTVVGDDVQEVTEDVEMYKKANYDSDSLLHWPETPVQSPYIELYEQTDQYMKRNPTATVDEAKRFVKSSPAFKQVIQVNNWYHNVISYGLNTALYHDKYSPMPKSEKRGYDDILHHNHTSDLIVFEFRDSQVAMRCRAAQNAFRRIKNFSPYEDSDEQERIDLLFRKFGIHSHSYKVPQKMTKQANKDVENTLDKFVKGETITSSMEPEIIPSLLDRQGDIFLKEMYENMKGKQTQEERIVKLRDQILALSKFEQQYNAALVGASMLMSFDRVNHKPNPSVCMIKGKINYLRDSAEKAKTYLIDESQTVRSKFRNYFEVLADTKGRVSLKEQYTLVTPARHRLRDLMESEFDEATGLTVFSLAGYPTEDVGDASYEQQECDMFNAYANIIMFMDNSVIDDKLVPCVREDIINSDIDFEKLKQICSMLKYAMGDSAYAKLKELTFSEKIKFEDEPMWFLMQIQRLRHGRSWIDRIIDHVSDHRMKYIVGAGAILGTAGLTTALIVHNHKKKKPLVKLPLNSSRMWTEGKVRYGKRKTTKRQNKSSDQHFDTSGEGKKKNMESPVDKENRRMTARQMKQEEKQQDGSWNDDTEMDYDKEAEYIEEQKQRFGITDDNKKDRRHNKKDKRSRDDSDDEDDDPNDELNRSIREELNDDGWTITNRRKMKKYSSLAELKKAQEVEYFTEPDDFEKLEEIQDKIEREQMKKNQVMTKESTLGKQQLTIKKFQNSLWRVFEDTTWLFYGTQIGPLILFPLHEIKDFDKLTLVSPTGNIKVVKEEIHILMPDLGAVYVPNIPAQKVRIRPASNEHVAIVVMDTNDEAVAGFGFMVESGIHSICTFAGDCGAPIISLTDNNIVGFHIAGHASMNRCIPIDEKLMGTIKTLIESKSKVKMQVQAMMRNPAPIDEIRYFVDKYPEELTGPLTIRPNRAGNSGLYEKYLDNNGMTLIGHVNKSARFVNKRKRMLFFDAYENKVGKHIPYEGFNLAPINEEAVFKHFSKYCTAKPALQEEHIQALEMAFSWLFDEFEPHLKNSRIMSKEEAHDDMNMNTGTAWPFNNRYQKKKEMEPVIDLTLSFMQEDFDELVCSNHVEPYTAAPKEELKSQEKIDMNELRAFCASSYTNSMHGKMLFGDMNKKFNDSFFKTCSTAGFNPFDGGWHKLIMLLSRLPFGYSLDGKKFDSSIMALLLWYVALFRFRMFSRELQTLENFIKVQSYYTNIIYSVIVMPDGTVVRKKDGNPSGSQCTLEDNGFISFMIIAYIYIRNSPANMRTYTDFKKNVELKVCGDDNTFTLSAEANKFMSASQCITTAAEINITFTTDFMQPRAAHELDYLSCTSTYLDGVWIPLIDKNKMLTSIRYSEDTDDPILQLQRACAYARLSYATPELYEHMIGYVMHLVDMYDKDFCFAEEWIIAKTNIPVETDVYQLYTGRMPKLLRSVERSSSGAKEKDLPEKMQKQSTRGKNTQKKTVMKKKVNKPKTVKKNPKPKVVKSVKRVKTLGSMTQNKFKVAIPNSTYASFKTRKQYFKTSHMKATDGIIINACDTISNVSSTSTSMAPGALVKSFDLAPMRMIEFSNKLVEYARLYTYFRFRKLNIWVHSIQPTTKSGLMCVGLVPDALENETVHDNIDQFVTLMNRSGSVSDHIYKPIGFKAPMRETIDFDKKKQFLIHESAQTDEQNYCQGRIEFRVEGLDSTLVPSVLNTVTLGIVQVEYELELYEFRSHATTKKTDSVFNMLLTTDPFDPDVEQKSAVMVPQTTDLEYLNVMAGESQLVGVRCQNVITSGGALLLGDQIQPILVGKLFDGTDLYWKYNPEGPANQVKHNKFINIFKGTKLFEGIKNSVEGNNNQPNFVQGLMLFTSVLNALNNVPWQQMWDKGYLLASTFQGVVEYFTVDTTSIDNALDDLDTLLRRKKDSVIKDFEIREMENLDLLNIIIEVCKLAAGEKSPLAPYISVDVARHYMVLPRAVLSKALRQRADYSALLGVLSE